MENRLYIYDAHSGKLRVSSGSFLTIGAADTNTFHVSMRARTGGTFACKGDFCRFFLHGSLEDYSLNGAHSSRDTAITKGEVHLMVLAGGCLICWYGEEKDVPDFVNLNPQSWYAYDIAAKAWSEPMRLSEICNLEETLAPDTLISFEGLDNQAFLARDIMEASRFAQQLEQAKAADNKPADQIFRPIPEFLTCPHCWEKFKQDQILSIACHPELQGDNILGPSAMKRFAPQTYNLEGVPLDDAGYPCRATACPHCHRKLPPFFTGTPQHIVSVIGAPYSGKTYLLASMVQEAFKEFPREFDVTFRDSDAKRNAAFNQLRQKFFTATDPFQAYLKNTELTDATMQRVWKKQKFRMLPAPVSFAISRQGAAPSRLVFYDTPGESFLPGQTDYKVVMAGGHTAVASAYFFIFDPTLSRSFRRLITDSKDPQMQLDLAATNLQTQMLAELETQLRDELNQPAPQKLNIPLAIILDKSDVWLHLLGPEPLLPVVRHGRVQTSCLLSNSKRLRRLLFSIAPQVCANAEALSDNVCYFAVSSLGESPITFNDEEGSGVYIGPESGAVSPVHITDPLLWVLSTLEPGLLPRNN